MDVQPTTIDRILTRTSGYLRTVASHSLQPYRGCSFGNALCGVGCYVQHNRYLTEGRPWGSFLEVRTNAAESYLRHAPKERRYARQRCGRFSIFMSSATEPFLPQETRYGVTEALLRAMLSEPPDVLIVQTHSHRVAERIELLQTLAIRCQVRVHLSIETDREEIPGLPPHASSVARRLEAAEKVHCAGLTTVVTVSPLLPIADPEAFFARIARCADGVVLDHFIGGDGTPQGWRTRRTALPTAMAALDPASVEPGYRDVMAAIAERHLPGRVGLHIAGFARDWVHVPAK